MSSLKDNTSSILLVDDESDIVEIMKSGLQHDSFDVIGFTNPQIALEHFEMNAKRVPLVISDVNATDEWIRICKKGQENKTKSQGLFDDCF